MSVYLLPTFTSRTRDSDMSTLLKSKSTLTDSGPTVIEAYKGFVCQLAAIVIARVLGSTALGDV